MNDFGWLILGIAVRASALASLGLLASRGLKSRGPSSVALSASTTLAVLIVVFGLGPSPWPRWRAPLESKSVSGDPPRAPVALASDLRPLNLEIRPSKPSSLAGSNWIALVSESWRELRWGEPLASERSKRSTWPSWVGWCFVAGLAVSMARLGLGLWAVRMLRGRSRGMVEPSVLVEVDALRAKMNLLRPVEIRETSEITTPATVGWLRPAILLPEDWPSWDLHERRAILAHELAHVLRGDYASGVLAQLSLSLHFYHPMVHALAARLRLQQELAADAWGAMLSGGQGPYLATLARLALRQGPGTPAWPVRPFLTTRKTLFRRIEMLREPSTLRNTPMARRGRAATVAALALAGLVVAGFRGPDGPNLALAQDPAKSSEKGVVKRVDPLTASANVKMIGELRPIDLIRKRPELIPMIQSLEDQPNQPFKMQEVEQILFLGIDRRKEDLAIASSPVAQIAPAFAMFVRLDRPIDWSKVIPSWAKEVRKDGLTYHRWGDTPGATCYLKLDDRTAYIGLEVDMKSPPVGFDRPRVAHSWDDAWLLAGSGEGKLAFDIAWMNANVFTLIGQPLEAIRAIAAPLIDKPLAYGLALEASDGLALRLRAICRSRDDVGRVYETLNALKLLLNNAFDTSVLPQLRQASNAPGEAGLAFKTLTAGLSKAANVLVDSDTSDPTKFIARVSTSLDAPSLKAAILVLTPVLQAARREAMKAVAMNHGKQVVLAMFNYMAIHDHYPPAVLFGPDGKTPYSWRVAILPFMEAQKLYDQYKFDEPWDGPNNIKLVDQMPTFYGDGTNPNDHTHPSFFVPTGPQTIFPPKSPGTKIGAITDGTSNTLLLVQARRDTPWTRPDDIAILPDQPLPELGGTFPGGFIGLTADGAARFFKSSINPVLLRAMFTSNGGEVIEMPND